jgi:hypothetical protein
VGLVGNPGEPFEIVASHVSLSQWPESHRSVRMRCKAASISAAVPKRSALAGAHA